MRITHQFLFTAALVVLLTGASCVRIRTAQPTGGIWVSTDGGKQWVVSSALFTTGGKQLSFQSDAIVSLQMDPTNANVLYALRKQSGVAVSTDGGKQWLALETLPAKEVNVFGVNPLVPCTLFAGAPQVLFESTDCGHGWRRVLELPPQTRVTALAMDREHPQHLYAALSNGDLLRSDDGARTWRTLLRTKGVMTIMLINPLENATLTALLPGSAFMVSHDFGETWTDQTSTLPAKAVLNNALIVADPSNARRLWLAGSAGLFRSDDGGQTWAAVQLLTAPNTAVIRALAINPRASAQIVYGTNTALYRSPNDGIRWETFKLPTPAIPTTLIIHPERPSTLYLAVGETP